MIEILGLLAADPAHGEAWRLLGDIRLRADNPTAADTAYGRHVLCATANPILMAAAAALSANDLATAERLLKPRLKQAPTDVAAIRMLAELAARLGRYADSEALLARCLDLAPSFRAARHNYAYILQRQNRPLESLAEAERILADEPHDPNGRNLKAGALVQVGRYDEAVRLYEGILQQFPTQPKAWLNYGHALKTEGRGKDSAAAYRRCAELAPSFGEAYWSLANLKTTRFGEAEIAAMEELAKREDLSDDDRLHFHFALGKACEDLKRDAEAFAHYEAGNRLRRAQLGYDAEDTSRRITRMIETCTPALFAKQAGSGAPDPDPIFIVGLPRSGSTLVEQILASHPAIEGTMELPDLPAMAKRLGERRSRGDASLYPEILADLSPAELRALGDDYLARTKIQRREGRPFFIDKLPNNFLHIGLIHLILPNARIIDVRRHPMAACFSGFKQHFARGQAFSYGLEDIGRYYRDYVGLMDHVDRVLPGRVHRVLYERLVADTESEIKKLLDYCGLPFDTACLRFHETERSVRTASAEQVRTPIYTSGLDQWRRFEDRLSPLRDALGPDLSAA